MIYKLWLLPMHDWARERAVDSAREENIKVTVKPWPRGSVG